MYLDLAKNPLLLRQPTSRPAPWASVQTPAPRTDPERDELSAWASHAMRASGFGDAA